MREVITSSSYELVKTASEVITLVLENKNNKINYNLSDGEYKILIFNNANCDVSLLEEGTINNSNVEITYIDLNNYEFKQENTLNVLKGSSLKVNSIYLGINKKRINFDITNKESYSAVNIDNNVVCLKDGDIELNVIGNIVKGAKQAKCHQSSRCLTFEEPKKAKVLPVLNIDECDVEASHSLSSGTIDEDVLFYMNSRGISKKEALGLLLVSYLMPSEEFYKEFNSQDLYEIANAKVKETCSM